MRHESLSHIISPRLTSSIPEPWVKAACLLPSTEQYKHAALLSLSTIWFSTSSQIMMFRVGAGKWTQPQACGTRYRDCLPCFTEGFVTQKCFEENLSQKGPGLAQKLRPLVASNGRANSARCSKKTVTAHAKSHWQVSLK